MNSTNNDQQQQEEEEEEEDASKNKDKNTVEEEETHWTDDRIRWSDTEDDDDDNDNNDDQNSSNQLLFQESPEKTFIFTFQNNINYEIINIQLDGYKYNSNQIWKSTGLTIWKASKRLCQYIIENQIRILSILNDNNNDNNNNILELGSGLGLVSLLIANVLKSNNNQQQQQQGEAVAVHHHVYCTDGDTLVLKKLRYNIEKYYNNNNNNINSKVTVSCHQLLWGIETSEKFLYNIMHNIKFNIIVGSDLIYSYIVIEPMFQTIHTLLDKTYNSVFILAFAKRRVPVTINDIINTANKYGFISNCIISDEYNDDDNNNNNNEDNDDKIAVEEEEDHIQGIYIYEFRWKEEFI